MEPKCLTDASLALSDYGSREAHAEGQDELEE